MNVLSVNVSDAGRRRYGGFDGPASGQKHSNQQRQGCAPPHVYIWWLSPGWQFSRRWQFSSCWSTIGRLPSGFPPPSPPSGPHRGPAPSEQSPSGPPPYRSPPAMPVDGFAAPHAQANIQQQHCMNIVNVLQIGSLMTHAVLM